MLSSSSGRGRLDLKRRPPFWLLPTTTPTALVLVSDAAALLRCAARRWEMTPPPPPPLLLLARAAMRDADWTMALMVIAIVIVWIDCRYLLSLVMVGRGCCCVSLLFYVWCWKLLEEDGVRHFVVCCSSRHGQTDIVSLVILRFRDRFGCNTILDPM